MLTIILFSYIVDIIKICWKSKDDFHYRLLSTLMRHERKLLMILISKTNIKSIKNDQDEEHIWQPYRGVYFVWEFLYLPQFFLKPSTIQKKFLPSEQPVHIGGYSSIFVNWGGRKDKEFLVIFRKNKGILSACGQKFHWKLQFYINSYHNFVNISSNPTSKPYTFHNSFLIPSTQKFFIGDLRSPIFHKIYSPGRKTHLTCHKNINF